MSISPLALSCKGILAIVIGTVVVVWPHITVDAFVIIFAVYVFSAAVTEAMRLLESRSALPVIGRVLLILLDVIAGVAALSWPTVTAHAIVLIVAAWAFVTGIAELGFAFAGIDIAGRRALVALDGLISIALSLVLAIRPDCGAVAIAQVYGLFSLICGVSALALAYVLRHPDGVPTSIVEGAVI